MSDNDGAIEVVANGEGHRLLGRFIGIAGDGLHGNAVTIQFPGDLSGSFETDNDPTAVVRSFTYSLKRINLNVDDRSARDGILPKRLPAAYADSDRNPECDWTVYSWRAISVSLEEYEQLFDHPGFEPVNDDPAPEDGLGEPLRTHTVDFVGGSRVFVPRTPHVRVIPEPTAKKRAEEHNKPGRDHRARLKQIIEQHDEEVANRARSRHAQMIERGRKHADEIIAKRTHGRHGTTPDPTPYPVYDSSSWAPAQPESKRLTAIKRLFKDFSGK